ncbi:brachyurin-like isoform X2 [Cloeon dipterum]|uniref:brachyurin-like isoform X2 n=1 Tax=Cloeon dipterum TaxID=197152 RepID=UPI00321FA9A7
MRSSRWIVVLAILAQASARVSKCLKEDAKKTGNVDVEVVTEEHTLEAMVADANYTETETFLSKLENNTNSGVNPTTAKPIYHNGTDDNGRILGGIPLTAATFVSPFTAYVFIQALNAGGVVIEECGGVILSSVWVLTAAHCVALATDITVFAGTIVNPLNMATSSSTATAIIHPNFRLNYDINDIALLNLDTPLTLSGTVGTARLSTVKPTAALDNIVFTTLGFGRADDATVTVVVQPPPVKTVSDTQTLNNAPYNAQARVSFVDAMSTLNVIDMQNMNKETCNAQTIGIFVTYPGNTGCLNTASGTKGVCFADEGGPVFYTSPAEISGKVIGINSQIVGCPRQQPSSFTWIYPYISWIHSTTLKTFT